MKLLQRLSFKLLLYSFVILFLLSFNQLYGNGVLFTSLGYSPGQTNDYRLNFDPPTKTLKYIGFGLNLTGNYLYSNHMGFGVDFHWGIIHKMEIKNNSTSYILDNWDGIVSQFNISPFFLYEPVKKMKMNLVLGIGLSYTLNFYTSDIGYDASEHYFGISLKTHYNYFLTDYFFLNAGFRFSFDFIGVWEASLVTGIIQLQFYPVLGLGYSF